MTDGPNPFPEPQPGQPGPQPSWPTPQPPSPASPEVPTGWQQPQPSTPPPGWQPPAQGGFQPGSPPAAPSGGFVPGDQGPKKKRKWPWILLGIFLLMVIGFGACSALLFKAIKGPADFGNKFTEKVYNSPSAAASDLCPGAAIDAAGVQKIHDDLVAAGWTGDKRLYGTQVNKSNGQSTALLTGTVGASTVTIELQEVNGDWCTMNFIDNSTLGIPDISIPELEITPVS